MQAEAECGAMLGPISQVNSSAFHCSPLLSHPKDGSKRRIILNLSHPHGASVNDNVSKEAFNNNKFTLKFPTIDSIINSVKTFSDLDRVLYKIDVARAFHNLRVDLVDAVKLGISWKGQFFLDLSIVFGGMHGSAAFHRLSDEIVYIMRKCDCVLHAYIDDYIGVAPGNEADHEFHSLAKLLHSLGLPMNPDKHTRPTKALTCLGIHIDIN